MSRLPAWLLRLTVALCCIGLIVLIGSYGIGRPAVALETAAPRLLPHTDVNPYGANFFLDLEVEGWKREKTVQMAQAAGIAWAKQSFSWEAIEPKVKGRFVDAEGRSTWQKYDDIVDLFARHDIQVIARLDRPPAWTRQDNRFPQRPPDRIEDYGDFVYAFVNHYKGRIRYIQIWNEPNIFPEWGAQPVNPQQYTELLKVAYQRAKQADPNIVVLSAPLAMTVENFPDRRNLSDLIFLEEMYKAGAQPYFDILSANAFGMAEPPDAPASPNKLNFQRVSLQRAIMETYGDTAKAVWLNEYGWNASPDDFPLEELTWQRVDERLQAQYTVDGIRLARERWPWIGVFNIWYFRQVGDKTPDRSDYYFRMVDVDFTPRLVYNQVKEAAPPLRTARNGIYQETSAPVQTSRGWGSVLASGASGGAYINSVQPGASLSFKFEGEAVYLVTTPGPGAGRCLVSLDDQPVSGLPRDGQGRSYIGLYEPQDKWQTRLTLAQGLSRSTHTLKLSVADGPTAAADGPRCIVDALVVEASPAPALPWPLVTLLLLGFLGGLGALVWRRRPASRSAPVGW